MPWWRCRPCQNWATPAARRDLSEHAVWVGRSDAARRLESRAGQGRVLRILRGRLRKTAGFEGTDRDMLARITYASL